MILQGAFAPLKNADRLMLRHQFLVPEMPITMAPKLDKIMDTACQSGVKCTDTALARPQALTLDAIGPLSDLEKVSSMWELLFGPLSCRGYGPVSVSFIGEHQYSVLYVPLYQGPGGL